MTAGCAHETPRNEEAASTEILYQPRWAERFRLETIGEDVVLTVHPPWRKAEGPGLQYRFSAGDLPVDQVVTTSTTEVAHLAALDAAQVLVGHSELDYVTSPSVRERIDAGEVAEVGGGSSLHPEPLLATDADIVLADLMTREELDRLRVVEDAGLPVVLVPSYLESHPLGRAEWVVVTGLLTGRLDAARELFAEIEAAYLDLRQRVGEEGGEPTVFTGGPWDDVWHVPGGRSFVARFLGDAGARYLWSSNESAGALALDLETVYDQAHEADVWLYPSHWTTLDEIRSADSRLADFAAFESGRVWANDRRTNGLGGNAFWESGSLRADVVLADLVKIFHPDVVPEHELVYHRRLPPRSTE